MKTAFLYLLVGVSLFTVSCGSTPRASVIRLAYSSQLGGWRMSIDAGRPKLVASSILVDSLARLSLRQGDLVILSASADQQAGRVLRSWVPVKEYCDSKQVAVYLYGAFAEGSGGDIFSTPVYHWASPFEDPRSLEKASFFLEGKYLGNGLKGFQQVLNHTVRTRPKQMFFLGSLYDLGAGFGPFERPYESHQVLLDRVIQGTRTELLLLDPAP